jgi:hypothetical protein
MSRPQQRIAFALAVGLRVLPLIPDTEGVAFARHAYADAVRWLSGEPVEAQTLTDHLMDDREEGLLLFEARCQDEACRRTWMPVQTALAYTAWHAWLAQGELPASLVSEVSEDTVDLLCQQALAAGQSHADLDALQRGVAAMTRYSVESLARL